MQASLMMVSYNRLELTKRTLNNLFQNTDYPFRLIIVDNGSSDGTPDFLRELMEKNDNRGNQNFLGYHIKLNNKNHGIAVGRNQCLVIANEFKDEWLACIDNDIELPNNWLSECIGVLKANPKYGMMGVNLEHVPYPLVSKNGKTFQHKAQGNLGSACMVFNRRLHRALGYFNMEYGNYGEEDADAGARCRALKFELGYIQENGKHIGVGELDTGEYRQFKDECRAKNLDKFRQNCADYMSGRKSCYIPFTDPTMETK